MRQSGAAFTAKGRANGIVLYNDGEGYIEKAVIEPMYATRIEGSTIEKTDTALRSPKAMVYPAFRPMRRVARAMRMGLLQGSSRLKGPTPPGRFPRH